MKKIILTILFCYISVSIYATKYFVSSTTGDDSNDGLTEQTAWKTISKVNTMMNSFRAGDVIALKRGDSFIDRVYINDKNGTEAEPITFTSYGSGTKPIIDVTREYIGIWTDQGNNIWKSIDGAYPSINKRIMIDGVEVLATMIQSELGTNIPDLVKAYSNDATKTIYVYSTTDPSGKTVEHSGLSRAIFILDSSYIVIEDIEVRGGYYHGITISKCQNVTVNNTKIGVMNNAGISVSGDATTHCTNIVIKNCYIDSFYRFDYRETPNRNNKKAEYRGMSDAIRFYDCIGGEVSNNTIIDAGHTSISLTAENDSFAEISGIKVFNNHCQLTGKRDYGGGITLDRNTFNIEVYNNFVDATKSSQMNGHDNHIHHNIFKDIKQPIMYDYPEGFGVDLASYAGEVHDNILENNIFDNCASGGIRFRATSTKLYNNKVRNNIIYNCGVNNNNKGIEIKYGSVIFKNNFFNNIIYNKNTTDVFFDGATDKYYTVSEFNAYTDYGTNADNQSGNPLFISTTDYHLTENSPAVNNGITTLATKDYDGNPIPNNGTLPDIGLYEYYENTTGSVNANAGADQSICLGESVTLSASGGSAFSWNTGATTQSITVNPKSTSTYTVTVFEGNVSDSDSVTVAVSSVTANAGTDQTITSGQSTTLTASGGDSCQWSTGATTASITVNPKKNTTYSVTVSKGNCEDTDNVIVSVSQDIVTNPPQANAYAGEDVSICSGQSVTLTANGGDTYLWSTGATTKSIHVNPTRTTTYTLSATRGGVTNSDTVIVTVGNCSALSEKTKKDEFTVYPNPTDGTINIKASNDYDSLNLNIYTINGSIVYSDKIQTINNIAYKTVDLSNLTKGIYIVRLYNSNYHKTKNFLLD